MVRIINPFIFASGGGYDSDAAAYIAAVEAADGASLATKYKDAINDFVVGAKTDGFWSAIKAACFLAGPATLAGALVPLVGDAPTNINFVGGDHDQVTGLAGNGSTKYLNSNRNNNADGQDDVHQSIWVSTSHTAGSVGAYIGTGTSGNGVTHIVSDSAGSNNRILWRCRTSSFAATTGASATGLISHSRSGSGSYVSWVSGSGTTRSATSSATAAGDVFVFARSSSGSPNNLASGRLAWYSIGSNLDQSLLDARLTTYMAAIA
jgi:hypothetical protein